MGSLFLIVLILILLGGIGLAAEILYLGIVIFLVMAVVGALSTQLSGGTILLLIILILLLRRRR